MQKIFFGTLHITGNNYIKDFPLNKNITNNASLTIMPNNEVWLFSEPGKLTIIRNDSLWRTFSPPAKNGFEITSPDKRFFSHIKK